ncbi:response regulator transcription factor [Cyanobacteria bacterium FACHB-63]|nr:response regulator transcription factor [Cyanobacteria bacterium FACHB-63]
MQATTLNPTIKSYEVLLVQADQAQSDLTKANLYQAGFNVTAIADGLQALNLIRSSHNRETPVKFDLIILGRILPKLGGLDLCRLLRQEGNLIPILLVSETTDEHDRVVGLEIGADDYLAQSVSDRILIARCRALLRRYHAVWQPPIVSNTLKFKKLTLYVEECRVTLSNQEIQLSPKEFALLREFMQSRGRVLSRANLLERVWGDDYIGDEKTVEVYIRWLRQKLEPDPSCPQYITTLRRFGYRMG